MRLRGAQKWFTSDNKPLYICWVKHKKIDTTIAGDRIVYYVISDVLYLYNYNKMRDVDKLIKLLSGAKLRYFRGKKVEQDIKFSDLYFSS